MPMPPTISTARVIWVMAAKDLRLLVRHRTAFFFTFVFPLLFGVGFGLVFQQVQGGPAPDGSAVASSDTDAGGDRSADRSGDGRGAGDAIAAILEREPTLRVVRAAPGDSAADLVLSGAASGVVVLEPGFEAALREPFGEARPTMRLVLDPSASAAAGILRGVLTAAGFELAGQNLMTNPGALDALIESEGLNPIERAGMLAIRGRIASIPHQASGGSGEDGENSAAGGFASPVDLIVEDARLALGNTEDRGAGAVAEIGSAFELTYPQAAAWAMMGCVTGFGLSLAGERSGGTLARLLGSPVRSWEVLASKALACGLTAGTALVVLRVVFWVLGVPVRSLWMELLSGALVVGAFVGLMVLLATACRSERGAEGFVRAVLLVLALLGGAGVPLVFFQGWIRGVTALSPFRWAIQALEAATWRQGGIGELLLPGGVLLTITIGCLGLGWLRFGNWLRQGA